MCVDQDLQGASATSRPRLPGQRRRGQCGDGRPGPQAQQPENPCAESTASAPAALGQAGETHLERRAHGQVARRAVRPAGAVHPTAGRPACGRSSRRARPAGPRRSGWPAAGPTQAASTVGGGFRLGAAPVSSPGDPAQTGHVPAPVPARRGRAACSRPVLAVVRRAVISTAQEALPGSSSRTWAASRASSSTISTRLPASQVRNCAARSSSPTGIRAASAPSSRRNLASTSDGLTGSVEPSRFR